MSRRDFVRAGAAAAIAAAASGDAFAGQDYPRGAFDACVSAIRDGAKTMTLSAGAETWLERNLLPMFTPEKKNIWDDYRPRVLAASAAIGTISAALAHINADKVIGDQHVEAAIAAVRKICLVKVGDQRWIFCPGGHS